MYNWTVRVAVRFVLMLQLSQKVSSSRSADAALGPLRWGVVSWRQGCHHLRFTTNTPLHVKRRHILMSSYKYDLVSPLSGELLSTRAEHWSYWSPQCLCPRLLSWKQSHLQAPRTLKIRLGFILYVCDTLESKVGVFIQGMSMLAILTSMLTSKEAIASWMSKLGSPLK